MRLASTSMAQAQPRWRLSDPSTLQGRARCLYTPALPRESAGSACRFRQPTLACRPRPIICGTSSYDNRADRGAAAGPFGLSHRADSVCRSDPASRRDSRSRHEPAAPDDAARYLCGPYCRCPRPKHKPPRTSSALVAIGRRVRGPGLGPRLFVYPARGFLRLANDLLGRLFHLAGRLLDLPFAGILLSSIMAPAASFMRPFNSSALPDIALLLAL